MNAKEIGTMTNSIPSSQPTGVQRAEIAAPKISFEYAYASLGWLGPITKIHWIGEFSIVEFTEKKTRKQGFAGFVGDRDLHEYWHSLDGAILGCLINKYNERNSATHVTPFVAKMIGVV